jgi:uncharacterized protein
MKNLAKRLSLLFFITGITYASCQQRNSNSQTEKFPKRDTMFVEVNNVKKPLVPTDYVNDYIQLFTQPQISSLDSIIIDYEKKTTNQVAIVTVDSQWIKKDSFESFIQKVFNTWGVGQKDKNNGIVIAICPGYRIIHIENGYGIDKVFTDDQTHHIIQNIIVPAYKKGEYYEGTRNALIEITKKVPAIK